MLNLDEATKFFMQTRFRWMARSSSSRRKMSVVLDPKDLSATVAAAEEDKKRISVLGMEAGFADKNSLVSQGMVFKPIDEK